MDIFTLFKAVPTWKLNHPEHPQRRNSNVLFVLASLLSFFLVIVCCWYTEDIFDIHIEIEPSLEISLFPPVAGPLKRFHVEFELI